VKPPRFKYHDPTTLDEALSLLASYGDDAKVLAGGQSLMPVLNFRLARPGHLIDINRVAELSSVGDSDGALALGALVRQRALERSDLIRERCPLISQALPYIGHPQIRNRGTIGGSVAHADPAAELPAVMLALDAKLTLRKVGGERVVAAEEFFITHLTTVLEPDELLIRIDLPAWPERTGSAVKEVAMRLGDFALGGVATMLTLGADGQVARARIACFGVDDRPIRVAEAEESLVGARPGERAFAEAGRIVTERVEPSDDIHASAGYRKRLAGILTTRALVESYGPIKELAA
jgi:CO/xanthine dehydrogenase FAD-binding subunit